MCTRTTSRLHAWNLFQGSAWRLITCGFACHERVHHMQSHQGGGIALTSQLAMAPMAQGARKQVRAGRSIGP